MNNYVKQFHKRGLALFLAFLMCLGMLPATAFAAEDSEHICNADGWVCEEVTTDVLTCETEEHVHTDECYVSETVYTCSPEDEEHEHTDECSTITQSKLDCTIEEHTHSHDECYTTNVEKTHMAPSEDVTRFLEAVKEISEQVTADDENAIAAAREAYEILSDADKSNYAVVEALKVLTAAEEALEAIDSNPAEDAGDESEDPGDVDVPEDGNEPEEGGETDGDTEPVDGGDGNEDEKSTEQSDAVKDFLAAVAELPEEITEENREEVEAQMEYICNTLFAALSDEELDLEEVVNAQERLAEIQALLTGDEPDVGPEDGDKTPTQWLQSQLDGGGTVILQADIEVEKGDDGGWKPHVGALHITRDNVVLDLNGYKLTWNTPTTRNGYSAAGEEDKNYPLDDERNLFTIESGATLTITDSGNHYDNSPENNAGMRKYPNSVVSDANTDPNNIFCVKQGGTLIIKDGVYSGNNAARGAWVEGNLIMEGGLFTNCKATSEFGGGGVYLKGTFTMDGDATIYWCEAANTTVGDAKGPGVNASYQKGGGVYIESGTFTLQKGTIFSCNAKDSDRGQGGGVYVASNGKFILSGDIDKSAITNNGANEGCGVYSAGTFTMSGGKVSNHYYISNDVYLCEAGGGIYIAGGIFDKTGGNVQANTAQKGGAIYVAAGDVTIGRTAIQGNYADQDGGGIYVAGGTVTINGTDDALWGNSAGERGGGIYIDTNAAVTMSAAMSVHQNQAKLGGGVYNAGTFNVTAQEAQIYKNYAAIAGDDVYSTGTLSLAPLKKEKRLDNGDAVDSRVAPNVSGKIIWQFWCPDYGQTDDNGNPKCPNHHVTDWFDDSEGDRWDAHDMDNNGFHAETYNPATASGTVALKAAHPPCTYEVEYYVSDDGETYRKVEMSELGVENAPATPATPGWTHEGDVMFGVQNASIQPLSWQNKPIVATLDFPERIVNNDYLLVDMKINGGAAANPYELRYNNDSQGNVFAVYYMKDVVGDPDDPDGDGEDGIPDAYQVKVTFQSENGRMGPTKIKGSQGEVTALDLFTKQQQFTKLVVYVTLFDEDGEMSASGTTKPLGDSVVPYGPETDETAWAIAQAVAKDSGAVIPTVGNHPDAYHTKPGSWDKDPKGQEISADMSDADRTFTYTYNPATAKITVNYIDEDDPNATYLKDSYISPEYRVKGSYDVTSQVEGPDSKIEGYVQTRNEIVGANGKRVGLKVDNVIDVVNFTVNVYYSKDVIGDPNGSDGIPDKYQVPVNYEVVNGTWNSEEGYTVSEDHVLTTYVTLYKNGNEAEGYALPTDADAKGYLTAEQIPSATANTGYAQESETWTDATPATTTEITGEVTYTVTYSPRNDLSYTVKYLEQGTDKELAPEKTVDGQTFGSEVTEQAIEINGYDLVGADAQTITIQVEDNEIIFYYTARDDLSYTVKYLEQGTNKELASEKTVDGQTFGSEVTEQAIEINGYDLVGADAQTITIQVEDNEIIFYYTAKVTPPVDPDPIDPDPVDPDPVDPDPVDPDPVDPDPVDPDPVDPDPVDPDPVDPTPSNPGRPTNPTPTNPGRPTTPSTPNRPTTTIPNQPTPLNPGTTIADQDVPLAHATGLNDVDHFAYVIGYDDDTVKPLNNITRAEVATIFFRLMTEEFRVTNWATSNSFTDVKDGDWYNIAVSTCANAGILKGYEDGTFQPNKAITRAEFAAIAARFMDDSIVDDGKGDFSDTASHWAAADIRRAAKAGWVNGDGNKFRPNDQITRAEVMTIVNRMLDRIPDKDHMLPDMKKWIDNPESEWYYEAVQEATNEHDYERDEMSVESWTLIKAHRDWAALELGWAQNNGASAPKTDAPVETPVDAGADAPVEVDAE